MMGWKDEVIAKYGEEAYRKKILQGQERIRAWRENNPQEVIELSRNVNRKGGKYYKKKLIRDRIGLRGERNKIRAIHRAKWQSYKKIIAFDSQIHHQWRPGTSEYDGVALVEKDQHQQGIIDVIQILEGEITLYSEEEVRRGNEE